MILKGLRDEDFLQYKLPSMFLVFPSCNWKCERECGMRGLCQNSALAKAPVIEYSVEGLLQRYLDNPISKAIVCGGLEPFDSWGQLQQLIEVFRATTDDPIIIYTGYEKEELTEQIIWLKSFKNVIIKFGRFIPNQEKHLDKVLGVYLASDNQYAERIS